MAEPLTCGTGITRPRARGPAGDPPEAGRDGSRLRRHAPSRPPARPEPAARPLLDQWPLLSHLELGALPGAVACARLHARQVLWEWGLSALAPDAELLVSELMTNATRASPPDEQVQPVGLWLSSDRSRLLILVQDTNRRPPDPVGRAGGDDERGRGLLIVDAISAKWGWDAQAGSSGKVVWALIEQQAEDQAIDRLPDQHRW